MQRVHVLGRDEVAAAGGAVPAEVLHPDGGALLDEDRQVRHLVQFGEHVRGDQDGLAGGRHLPQVVAQADPGPRIQPGGRLVQQQHPGVVDDGPGQGEPLLLAAGEHPGRLVRQGRQVLPLQQLGRPGAHRVPVHPVEPPHGHEDLAGRQGLPHPEGVRHPPDLPAHRAGVRRGIGTGDGDGAGVGLQEGGQDEQQGGLARAVGTHQGGDGTGRGHEVHPAQGPDRAEAARHPAGDDPRDARIRDGDRGLTCGDGAGICAHGTMVGHGAGGGKHAAPLSGCDRRGHAPRPSGPAP